MFVGGNDAPGPISQRPAGQLAKALVSVKGGAPGRLSAVAMSLIGLRTDAVRGYQPGQTIRE